MDHLGNHQPSTAERCQDIVISYHGDIDRGRATAAIDHFADDAIFEVHGRRLRGRGEILGFLSDRERRTDRHTVHVIANATASRTPSDSAPEEVVVSALVLLYARGSDGGYALERVLDTVHRFRATAQGWKIAARSSAPLHQPLPAS